MINLHNEQSQRTGRFNGFEKNIQLGGLNTKKPNRPTHLSQDQIDELLNHLPKRANQARRFVQHLGENPDALTNECNVAVLSVNLSDLAVKYNPYLADAGYELRCRLPERQVKNRLGEPTMIHLWGLYKLGGSNA
jgi:hypothetical protein